MNVIGKPSLSAVLTAAERKNAQTTPFYEYFFTDNIILLEGDFVNSF